MVIFLFDNIVSNEINMIDMSFKKMFFNKFIQFNNQVISINL